MAPNTSMGNVDTCRDMMQCVFSLTKLELDVFVFLNKKGAKKVEEVAEHFKKDRSSAYRALQSLSKCGLCQRKTLYLDKGGYYHVYEASSLEEIKNRSRECADNWHDMILKRIEEMDKSI